MCCGCAGLYAHPPPFIFRIESSSSQRTCIMRRRRNEKQFVTYRKIKWKNLDLGVCFVVFFTIHASARRSRKKVKRKYFYLQKCKNTLQIKCALVVSFSSRDVSFRESKKKQRRGKSLALFLSFSLSPALSSLSSQGGVDWRRSSIGGGRRRRRKNRRRTRLRAV